MNDMKLRKLQLAIDAFGLGLCLGGAVVYKSGGYAVATLWIIVALLAHLKLYKIESKTIKEE